MCQRGFFRTVGDSYKKSQTQQSHLYPASSDVVVWCLKSDWWIIANLSRDTPVKSKEAGFWWFLERVRFSEWDMMGWFARHVCSSSIIVYLNHIVDRIPPDLEPNRNSLEKSRINLYRWVQDLYPWPEQVLGLLWGGCFRRVSQPCLAKIDKFQNKHSFFMLFPAFIQRSRIFSDTVAVFYLSLVMVNRNVTKRPLTTLSSKKLKRICPTSKDVVVISVLLARWYVYFRSLKCRDLYASLWKISVYFRKLMVFDVHFCFETHPEVLRYRYMIIC